ncbi:MAG: exonuclease SbcCD subunit D C-terminal domain-containing protein [Saprospiraceae bacterium]|nr:exonuclease SbcCD subunit D C-terminal domain-containing protein [Saprospiraceae bacterium]
MKVLHTSDWHLGQKFLFRDREEEHQLALDWLLDVIQSQSIDMVIVAGDIFDTGNPPNYARRQYYQFLTRLTRTTCRYAIIIGGNHDSPAMLEAPKALLASLNVYVVGAGRDPKDEVISLTNAHGKVEAVVAAVPFLRDRDLRYSQAGETGTERIEQIKLGLKNHYTAVGKCVEPFAQKDVPILATGHLYATGAKTSTEQTKIYIGDQENIKVSDFPAIFHYVALGHIHRQQAVGGQQHIRYSGSLIPLSFSETQDDKGVLILSFEGGTLQNVEVKLLPVFRRLKSIRGTLAQVETSLKSFTEKGQRPLTPWVEVAVERKDLPARLDVYLQDFVRNMPLELIKIRVFSQHDSDTADQILPDNLEDVAVEDVFIRRMQQAGIAEDEQKELSTALAELRNWDFNEAYEK